MKTAFYIDKEGTVRYIVDLPESQDFVDQADDRSAYDSKGYETALQAAKDSAVPFADQEKMFDTFDCLHNKAYQLKIDTIHAIPDQYKVEVRTPEVFHEGKGWFWERRAFITPLKEERKKFLIEMMESDEKDGMYELPYDLLLGENITMKKRIVELEAQLEEYRRYVISLKW